MQQLIRALPRYKSSCTLPVMTIAYTPYSNLFSSHAPDHWVCFRVLQNVRVRLWHTCDLVSRCLEAKAKIKATEARSS